LCYACRELENRHDHTHHGRYISYIVNNTVVTAAETLTKHRVHNIIIWRYRKIPSTLRGQRMIVIVAVRALNARKHTHTRTASHGHKHTRSGNRTPRRNVDRGLRLGLFFLSPPVLSRRRQRSWSSPLRRPGDGLAERPLPRSRLWRWWRWLRDPVATGDAVVGTTCVVICSGCREFERGCCGVRVKKKNVCAGHENASHSDVGHIGMRSTDPANGSSL